MKMFKHFAIASLSILLLTTGFMAGCKKDNTGSANKKPVTYCDTAHCGGGTCDSVNQVCECPSGYKGYGCATQIRDKYIGVYQVLEHCNSDPSYSYQFHIITSAQDIAYVTVDNFANQGYTVSMSLREQYPGSNNYAATINAQTVSNGSSTAAISGNGNFSENSLTLDYQIQVVGSSYGNTCSFTATKQ